MIFTRVGPDTPFLRAKYPSHWIDIYGSGQIDCRGNGQCTMNANSIKGNRKSWISERF